MDILSLLIGPSRTGWAFEDLPSSEEECPIAVGLDTSATDEPDGLISSGELLLEKDTAIEPQNHLLATSPAYTAQLVNPMLQSVRDAFAMVLDSAVTKESVERRPHFAEMMAVTARIGVSGPANGAVALSFAEDAAIGAAERMLDKPLGRVSTEVLDALAELTNIIVGTAKSRLEMRLNMSLPVVTVDEIRALAFPEESAPMRIRCGSEVGALCVDFGFVRREEAVRRRGAGVLIYD